jgi:hypothetical protein
MKIGDIIDYLLVSDTSKLIVDLADSVIANPSLVETFPQTLGIIVLAVDDAKTSDRPSSQNALYLDTFRMTKERLNDI